MEAEVLQKRRAWLAQQLGRGVPDRVWDLLLEMSYPQDAEDNQGRENLVFMARLLLKARGIPPQGHHGVTKEYDGELDEYETERALTVAECLTKAAALRPSVRDFRAEILGGTTLMADQARPFVQSLAVQCLTRQQFAQWDIPLVGHSVKRLSVDPTALPATDTGRDEVVTISLLVEPPGCTVTVRHPDTAEDSFRLDRYVSAPAREGHLTRQWAWPGSVLDDLYFVGQELVRLYRWEAWDACWFVLTGQSCESAAPRVSPLTCSPQYTYTQDHEYAAITLTVEPWMPAASVLKAYRQYQKMLLHRDNRPLKVRNLALLRFVTQCMDDHGDLPPWRDLLEKWNTNRPEWRYRDVRNLNRDYHTTRQALLFPAYNKPVRKQNPPPPFED